MRIYISFITRKWIRFLVILLFLGGIIVLFVYVCTLISSLKIFLKNKYTFSFFIFIFFRFVIYFIYAQYWDFSLDLKILSISIIYIKSNFIIIRLCIIYLLFVLIIRIKLSQKFKGGIKSKIND